MSTFLFQFTLLLYIVAVVSYLVFFFSQKTMLRRRSRYIFMTGGIFHTLYIMAGFWETGSTPISNQHETISFFAWSLVWCYLSFRWRYTVRNLGTFVSFLTLILMLLAAVAPDQSTGMMAALRSWWLPVHAAIALIADGFLALACIGGIMYLLQEREIKNKRFGFFYSRLPSLDGLDKLNHHCLTIGFSLLTLGMITGSVWAKQAWGSYWQWDPKETWSLVTWLLYAGLVHQRVTMGWRGRRAAFMTIAGFISVLFTLWGVTYLLEGMHTYVK